MVKNKLLPIAMAVLLIASSSTTSVTAYAEEITDETIEISESMSDEGIDAEDVVSEAMSEETDEIFFESEEDDENALYEGSVEEEALYYDGELPVVTDFDWLCPGRFYYKTPTTQDNIWYSYRVQGPDTNMIITMMAGNQTILCPELFTIDGDYDLTFKTSTDYNDVKDFSSGAISEIKMIHYERPSASLDAPTGLRWDENQE